jgi:hypothetical protein
MMMQRMGLYEGPFRSIQLGKKTVEVWLYDEKRHCIQVGAIIEFMKVSDEKETVKVKVMVCSCMKRLLICIAIFRFPFLTVKDGRWRKCWRRPIPLYRRYGAAMESVSHPYPVARE